ncbi:MAG: hypothetical protein IJG45_02105 [Oscillospiraceae bacterium]|nr:hypothetical protein [Oscillospiraceae bacterium]
MQKIFELSRPAGDGSMTQITAAMQDAAIAHSLDLNIGFARMLKDFHALWMLVRCAVELKRLPVGTLRLQTFLRTPSASSSIRDFTLLDDEGVCGSALQCWVLADAKTRRIVSLKSVPALWSLPTPVPERTEVLKRVALPEALTDAAVWTVAPEEIDDNGHLNNVVYVRHAEALQKAPCLGLEIQFDRECFAGEVLRLQTCDGFVRGIKADGCESFRCCFRKESTP